MIYFFIEHAPVLVALFVLGAFLGSALLWSHRRLRADMNEYKADIKAFREDMKVSNARFNSRLDATNLRIDQTYQMILDIVKELKSSKPNS